MSAESPRRGVHKGAQVVSPQPIVDRSIIDSVAGIINDIVPQGYAGASNSDNKETISWARFEYADINDPTLYPDYNEGSSTPPLLLVLGYTVGVQVWLIAATGEATEVLSWRQGVIRTLRILPNPKTDDEHVDEFEAKRPMVAVCSEPDSTLPGPKFCDVNFISLKTGEPVHSVGFKNPVCDVLANKRSVVVTLLEKIAVFDARTLQNNITITTCYASPGPNPNPVALGTRWLAYSEKRLIPARRSSGGCEGEGVQSYTATVLYAAKSLGKGLRGLGETVASSLTGNSVSPMTVNNAGNDVTQPGVVTILDLQIARDEKELDDANAEAVIAHFTAHSDAIVAMTFDLTGALLMTADKRGHDFHVFRIQPHPGGPTLAAVHHLYILHRGDTTAKVQDMIFSSDARWAAVSTVRGTTHVFPVAPYGGSVGVRTHSTPHVVNRLSRFHKSAGLTDDGTRSHSPVSHAELPLSVYPYSNPRLPPYPHPTILHPLSQIRQPSSLNQVNNSSQPSRPQQRQRLHSDDSGTLPLKICACFAPPRAWIYAQRESSSKVVKRAVDSLFIMACHGNMIQYDLEPKPVAGVPKEKVCDDTMIELDVEAKGQWPLCRAPNSLELVPPLPLSNPLLSVTFAPKNNQELDTAEDRWLSQVEIVTHAGPHRRLWMGPQFVFKTYNAPSGVAVNLVEAEAVEIGITGSRPARSKPVNMPHAASRPLMPVVIDGSGSSYEQSPRFMEAYGDPLDSENVAVGSCESQLREDLAEAMLEISIASHRAPGRRTVIERVGQPVTKVVNPHTGTVITVSADEDEDSISSIQEYDSAPEEIHAPRSVCAEEGPASLGAADHLSDVPESRALSCEHTEICAEMRTASEPTAIDSVPDENIRELQERRALCAEMATMTSTSIDYEREGAFRDVPTSLSLCAEPGEIPSSPMTQAKETAMWCSSKAGGRSAVDKRAEDHRVHEAHLEKHLAKAKYVVSYDDDSVTLMENKTMRGERNIEMQSASADEKAKRSFARRSIVVDSEKASSFEAASVVVEDARCADPTSRVCTEKEEGEEENLAKLAPKAGKTGLLLDDDDDELPPLDPPPLDDFNSIEYHMVEPCKDATSTATQSDDDIEHIHASEVTQMRARIDAGDDKCRDDALFGSTAAQSFSPVEQRKSSKSTISDDDLEYIHSSEFGGLDSASLGDVTYTAKSTTKACNERGSRRRHSKHALSSDDDLEHVQLSEICELELGAMSSSLQETEQQEAKSRLSKKRKDIMVIEKSDAEAAEITVIYNPLEEIWLKSEEVADKYSLADHLKDKPEGSSPTRRAKSRVSKTAANSSSLSGKRSSQIVASDIVEIIDIDAMQRADTDADSTPECKILPAATGTRVRKSRKSKKSQADGQENSSTELSFSSASAPLPSFRSSRVKMADLREAVQDESSFVDFSKSLQEQKAQTSPSTEISWSSIVKKSISLSDSQEGRKETDLEPLIEVEEKPEAGEHAKKLRSKILEFCDEDDDRVFFESGVCKRESTRRRAFKVEEKEKEEPLGEKDNDETTTTTTTTAMEETILIDLPAPVIDEEPRTDGDLVGVTVQAMARAKMPHQDREDNKEQSLLAPEVRSVVEKTRRGNVPAERRESQRESSLQLQPVLRQQQVAEGGNDPSPALTVSEDAGSDACPKHAEKRSETESSTAAKKTSNRSKRKKRR
ncbi:breast carcinoma-amplified sequence 3 [Lasius niger]|uniref:Breast carcinoma-amplified sequence 3 n=1 Tax=Lasius niger TaxID=67767 RepID=A0A0J7L0C9_LASNI|nr:breast carcinoma-amplified sequence 3 [Lasius niger]